MRQHSPTTPYASAFYSCESRWMQQHINTCLLSLATIPLSLHFLHFRIEMSLFHLLFISYLVYSLCFYNLIKLRESTSFKAWQLWKCVLFALNEKDMLAQCLFVLWLHTIENERGQSSGPNMKFCFCHQNQNGITDSFQVYLQIHSFSEDSFRIVILKHWPITHELPFPISFDSLNEIGRNSKLAFYKILHFFYILEIIKEILETSGSYVLLKV